MLIFLNIGVILVREIMSDKKDNRFSYLMNIRFDAERRGRHSQTEFGNEEKLFHARSLMGFICTV